MLGVKSSLSQVCHPDEGRMVMVWKATAKAEEGYSLAIAIKQHTTEINTPSE
jgi:hypothetical protein